MRIPGFTEPVHGEVWQRHRLASPRMARRDNQRVRRPRRQRANRIGLAAHCDPGPLKANVEPKMGVMLGRHVDHRGRERFTLGSNAGMYAPVKVGNVGSQELDNSGV